MSALQPSARPEAPSPGLILSALAGAVMESRLERGAPSPVCVGFSGGSDSLALLHMARAWAQDAGRKVLALTVDHGLQPQSAGWTARCERTARALGVGFRALRWSVEKPRSGLPAAARRARHALLAEAAREAGAQVILLGHTADDLAEAALMREAGSSVGSPAEWAPSPVWPEGRGIFLLRPLLGQRRAGLRAILADAGLDWIEDPANEDPRYARTRARGALAHHQGHQGHQVPVNPEGPLPLRLGDLGDLGGLNATADAFGVIRLPRTAPARLVGMACVCAGGGERAPRGERLVRLMARIASGAAFTATLAGARIVAGQELLICREPGELRRRPSPPLRLEPGTPAVWDGRFLIETGPPGVSVGALQGFASRLPKAEQRALKAVPAAARAGLPLCHVGKTVTCPILAEGSSASAHALTGERLTGACGRIAREGGLSPGADSERRTGALS
jgi:tRNA(Ile)-lysidine synthase